MLLGVYASRSASWDSNLWSLDINGCLTEEKKSHCPQPQCQDLLPNSAAVLLCGSEKVLRAGCVMCMRETRGHRLLKSRGIGASPRHQRAEKLQPLGGSVPPSPQENSDIVPLHGRIMRLNSCVTNFNTRGGCLKLKALLSEERAGRQHFNEIYIQPLCA